ncbi:MAG: helix-turn-helix domain-containing protein [Corynebacterium sp.]|nr:helix-turn-helix domain-containing protein [Corynebacterium sp.]
MKTKPTISPYMTGREAADYLRSSVRTIQRYAQEGKLSRVRLTGGKVLYIREELEALVEKHTYRI